LEKAKAHIGERVELKAILERSEKCQGNIVDDSGRILRVVHRDPAAFFPVQHFIGQPRAHAKDIRHTLDQKVSEHAPEAKTQKPPMKLLEPAIRPPLLKDVQPNNYP
jgi:hypothetical protein